MEPLIGECGVWGGSHSSTRESRGREGRGEHERGLEPGTLDPAGRGPAHGVLGRGGGWAVLALLGL